MPKEKKHTFQCADTPQRSFKYFVDLKNKKEFCDVTLQFGDETISAHRVIITAVIPYFRDILISQKHQREVSIPNVDPGTLKCFIEFAYTCETKIDEENVRNLLAAACHLGVDAVRDACCDFLVDIMEHDNVLNIYKLADSLNCAELLKCSDSYIKRNFKRVSRTKCFLQCPSTYLGELIGEDDLNVSNEEEVLEAVLKWVKSSPEERSADLPDLMRKVRMPLLAPSYLAKAVEQEDVIRTSLLCRDLIDKAINYVLHPELGRSTCSFVTELRESMKTSKPTETKSHYICMLLNQMKFTAVRFDVEEKKLHAKGRKSFFVNDGSSVEVHKKMYFFKSDTLVEYDPANDIYRHLDSMPTPRGFAAVAALKDQIYVCGGQVNLVPFNTVERFDPETDKWTSVRSMQISCWGSSSVILDDYIFVLGGKDRASVYDTVQRYDSVMDKWKFMSPLLAKRSHAGAATLDDKIYICGGFVFAGETSLLVSSTAEVYDANVNTWTMISSLNCARSLLILLSSSTRLYALGGVNNNGNRVKSIEIYDPESGCWTTEEVENFRVSAAVLI